MRLMVQFHLIVTAAHFSRRAARQVDVHRMRAGDILIQRAGETRQTLTVGHCQRPMRAHHHARHAI